MARLLTAPHTGATQPLHTRNTHTHATYTRHFPPHPHSFPRVTAQHVSKRNHSKIHFTCFVVCPACFLCACHAPLHPQPMPIKIFNYFAFYNFLFLSFFEIEFELLSLSSCALRFFMILSSYIYLTIDRSINVLWQCEWCATASSTFDIVYLCICIIKCVYLYARLINWDIERYCIYLMRNTRKINNKLKTIFI